MQRVNSKRNNFLSKFQKKQLPLQTKYKSTMTTKTSNRWLSYVPVVFLILSLSLVIRLYGSDALAGGSQIALLFSTGICGLIAVFCYKMRWADIEDATFKSFNSITASIIILLLIGCLSGIWMISGIVPTLIYYGIQIIHPQFYLLCTCLICCVVSVMTGSSWTTIATVGIALLGIGKAQGFSEGWIAGAIISGAYFGDKVSPLSDTTVLASSMSGTPLFAHIRYMLITTVPSLIIALLVFGIVGVSHELKDVSLLNEYTETLSKTFNLSLWLLVVPIVTGIMIAKKMPAIAVLFLSSMLAAVFAIIFQPEIIAQIAGSKEVSNGALVDGILKGLYGSTQILTGNADIDQLVATRGMGGMLNTVWLILCAMCFGSCMKVSGMLQDVAQIFTKFTKTRTSLVGSTVASGMFFNTTVSDQYLSIILCANIFNKIYEKNGYENRLLSRAIEDSATATSPLVPWNTCGMTQATILNISTLTYLPYCVFNIMSPFMSVIVAFIGYKVFRKQPVNEESQIPE